VFQGIKSLKFLLDLQMIWLLLDQGPCTLHQPTYCVFRSWHQSVRNGARGYVQEYRHRWRSIPCQLRHHGQLRGRN